MRAGVFGHGLVADRGIEAFEDGTVGGGPGVPALHDVVTGGLRGHGVVRVDFQLDFVTVFGVEDSQAAIIVVEHLNKRSVAGSNALEDKFAVAGGGDDVVEVVVADVDEPQIHRTSAFDGSFDGEIFLFGAAAEHYQAQRHKHNRERSHNSMGVMRTRASTKRSASSIVLYTPIDARTVPDTPSTSISGCAQW